MKVDIGGGLGGSSTTSSKTKKYDFSGIKYGAPINPPPMFQLCCALQAPCHTRVFGHARNNRPGANPLRCLIVH